MLVLLEFSDSCSSTRQSLHWPFRLSQVETRCLQISNLYMRTSALVLPPCPHFSDPSLPPHCGRPSWMTPNLHPSGTSINDKKPDTNPKIFEALMQVFIFVLSLTRDDIWLFIIVQSQRNAETESCQIQRVQKALHLSISNCNLNLHSRLNADGSNLLDNLWWAVQIDETLVDSHLEAIPRLGTLTTGSFPGGDTESLGWHSHWPLHLQLLVLGTTDQISANLFEALDITACQRNTDSMNSCLFSWGLANQDGETRVFFFFFFFLGKKGKWYSGFLNGKQIFVLV